MRLRILGHLFDGVEYVLSHRIKQILGDRLGGGRLTFGMSRLLSHNFVIKKADRVFAKERLAAK